MTGVADDLIGRAAAQSGLVPTNVESARPALEVLVPEIRRSRTLKPGALKQIEDFLTATMAARLGIEDWWERHPEIQAAPVEQPVFIMGMPRSGTTLLFNMLCLDPRRRVYWNWEANREVPPAQSAHLHDDPRIAKRVAEVDAMLDSGALPRNHHVERGDEPTECLWPLGEDFKAYPWLVQTIVPDYFEWLMHEADMVAAYRYHRRALQVMQSQAPGWWTLKLPSHARALEEILTVYPDARIVFTHRDPVKPVGSSCSLVEQILSLQNEAVDRQVVGYQSAKLNALGAERMSAARDAHPDTPFLDIHYRQFVRDPMATIRRLYEFTGADLRAEVEMRMQQALDRHDAERAEAGEHRYRLEDYGLSRAGLNQMFGDYVSRYQIETED